MHLSVTGSSTETSLGAHPSIGLIYPFIDKISVLLSCRWQFPSGFDMMSLALGVSVVPVDVQSEGDHCWCWRQAGLSCFCQGRCNGSSLALTKPKSQICIWCGFCSLSQLKRMAWDWDRPWHLYFCQNPVLLLSSIHGYLSVALSISFPGRQRNFLVKGAEHWDHGHLKDNPINSGVLQLGSCSWILPKRIQRPSPIPFYFTSL